MFPSWFAPINPMTVVDTKLNIAARYYGPAAVTINGVLFAGLLFRAHDNAFYMLVGDQQPEDPDAAFVRFIALEHLTPEAVILPSVEIAPDAAIQAMAHGPISFDPLPEQQALVFDPPPVADDPPGGPETSISGVSYSAR